MTAAVQSFVFCDSVVIDAQSNKAIVQGIFDRVTAQSYPAMHGQCSIFIRLALAPGESTCSLSLRLRSPAGDEVSLIESQKVSATGPLGVVQTIINLQGLPLPIAGNYAFLLLVDDESASSFAFEALQMGNQNAPAGRSMH